MPAGGPSLPPWSHGLARLDAAVVGRLVNIGSVAEP